MSQMNLFAAPADASELGNARLLRDRMIDLAVSHADQVSEGWSRNAYLFLVRYAQKHFEFIAHDCLVAFSDDGYDQPGVGKEWGAVFLRAAKLGVIQRNGYAQAPHRHASPCPRWQSKIYRGAA